MDNIIKSEERQFDMWDDLLGISCGGYDSIIDLYIINTLKSIIQQNYSGIIPEKYDTGGKDMETFIRYILCSRDICDYGTSPRSCFINSSKYTEDSFKELIKKCEDWYEDKWGERP